MGVAPGQDPDGSPSRLRRWLTRQRPNPYRQAFSRRGDPQTKRRARNGVLLGEGVGAVLYVVFWFLIPHTTTGLIIMGVLLVLIVAWILW